MTGTQESGAKPIVVGIDGSVAGLRALSWAAQEANLRNCPLVVVHAWDNVPLPGAMFTSAEELRRASDIFIDNECAAVTRTLGEAPEMVRRSVQGPAARVLISESVDAAMLVVGRSRHAPFRDLLPKSVSATVVRGAPCTVVVVSDPASPEAEQEIATQEQSTTVVT